MIKRKWQACVSPNEGEPSVDYADVPQGSGNIIELNNDCSPAKVSAAGFGLDASNQGGGIFIQPWPVLDTYIPDAIAASKVKGKTCLVTANESDTVDPMEQVTTLLYPDAFNSSNDENDSFDDRSDDKGPEPEGVTVGKVKGRDFAFVGLERIGGVMIFDVSDPRNPRYVSYTNNRDFLVEDVENEDAGDLGPEGLVFISEDDSPMVNLYCL